MNDDFKEELKDCYADLQKLNERNAEYIGTIDRLRRRVAETDVEIERLRAALEAWNSAVRVDVLMEGPRYMGVSGTAGARAWELTRAALTQEKPND